jgi:hypothetical protein
MTETQVSAADLKVLDPKRFEREYWKWTEHAVEYQWWDCVVDQFVETAKGAEFEVSPDTVKFSVHGGQGDGAAFDGTIYIHEWMARHGLHETYPALYLDLAEYTALAHINAGQGYYIRGVEASYAPGNCHPTGIFADLPEEAWDELVGSQWEEAKDEILDGIKDEAKALAAQLHEDLTEDYEYLTSEAAFIEHCQANDITFSIDEDN